MAQLRCQLPSSLPCLAFQYIYFFLFLLFLCVVEFPEDADTCFAKVTAGVELLQLMMDIPVQQSNGIRMTKPVTITGTRIASL